MSNESQRKVTSFRADESVLKEAKRKARQQGRTITEVINDLLRAYIGINSPIDDLQDELMELEAEKSHIEAKMEEIKREIEERKGQIPDGVKDYLRGPFQNQEKSIQEKRIREFSRKLDMEPEEFVETAKEEVEGFDGI